MLILLPFPLLQCGFLIWCMFPVANNGSVVIYHRLIKPFVAKHEKEIEGALNLGARYAREAGKKGSSCCV